MSSCTDAVKTYFFARNENWIKPNADLFEKVVQQNTEPKWLKRVVRQAEQKRESYEVSEKRLGRAHSKVDILSMDRQTEVTSITLTAVEKICWTYQDATQPAVECRLIYHRQIWSCVDSHWILKHATETREGKSFLSNDESPTVNSDIKLPRKHPVREGSRYDRLQAIRYADIWWDNFNPRYPKLTDDCTNFISQCIHAGGLPMDKTSNLVNGWWINTRDKGNWSYSWTTSNALYHYLRKHVQAQLLKNPSELKMGDLVFFDWDGSGTYHHTTIVTDFDDHGEPLVNAHTAPSFHRPFAYYDSPAWTNSTRYAFVHLPDDLQQKK